MTNQDKERAEFEAWYTNKHSLAITIRLASDRYYSPLVESAWQVWQTSAERSAKRIAELEAEVARLKADSERLDAIASEYFSLEPFAISYGDDADVGWTVLQHHCGESGPRIIAMAYRDDLRAVIDEAMKGGA